MVQELDTPIPVKSLPLAPSDILQSISDEDAREIAGQSHSQLLENAFTELSSALETSLPNFEELRAKYGQRLTNFWVLALSAYAHSTSEGTQPLQLDGEPVTVGSQQISARLLGERGTSGDQVLQIIRKTPIEEGEASIIVSQTPDNNVSLHLQAARSKTLLPPNGGPRTSFEVSLNGTIGRISRSVIRTNPVSQRTTVTDSKVIDCSTSG